MKKVALTNYYNFAKNTKKELICKFCKEPIRTGARTYCSSCGDVFCRSHMVPFIGNDKKCPDCRKKQSQFLQQEPVLDAMKVAENKIQNLKVSEYQVLENVIFASIFGKNNLIKVAESEEQENTEQNNLTNPIESKQNPELKPQTDTQPEISEPAQQQSVLAPSQTAITENEETSKINTEQVEFAADSLANSIAESLKSAGIAANSEDAVATILNTIFATSADSKKTVVAFKGIFNPESNFQKKLAEGANAQMGLPAFTGYYIFTPEQANMANKLWSELVSSGALSLEPETDPMTQESNRQKLLKQSEYISKLGVALNLPTDVLAQNIRGQTYDTASPLLSVIPGNEAYMLQKMYPWLR